MGAANHNEFLLGLEDRICPLEDANEITSTAAEMLGRYLQVDRCAYADVEDDQDTFNLTGDFTHGVASIVGRYTFAQFGAECLRLMRANQPYVVEDSESDPRTAEVRESYRATQIRAVICVPLHKAGRFVAAMAVHRKSVHQWRSDQVELVRQVASRCWESIERARVTRQLQLLNASLAQQVVFSERQFEQLVNGIVDCAVYMLDPTGRVSTWNPGAARIKGYTADEVIGQSFARFYPEEDRRVGQPDRSLQIARTQGKFEGEGWRVRKDGSRFWAQVLIDPIYAPDGSLTGFAKITRDMTERRAIQQQLAQSQKMEALGQLSGGIAHDFNNMLVAVIGNLDLLRRRLERGETNVDQFIGSALEGASKAAVLTQRLLTYARQQPLEAKTLNVNKLVGAMADLLQRTLGEKIEIETVLAGGLWPVFTDANQLESALVNLAVNARDAMPDGGKLTIETSNAHFDEEFAAAHVGVPAGQYIMVAVSDTGSGMPPETVARAFDPFFTTKGVGKGTGLGLSQVHGFVHQSKGYVKIYSETGQGTTVKIYLPRHHGPLDALPAKTESKTAPRAQRPRTVLLVEDEEQVRSFGVLALEELGYSVLVASSAREALSILEQDTPIDLLFTDVVMPEMDGRKLADMARTKRPDIKVLFTTGYTRNAIVHNGMLDRDVDLIGKPFTLDQLARKLAKVLSDGRPFGS